MKKNELPSFISNPDPTIYQTGIGLVLDIETTNTEKGDARYDNEIVCYSTKMVRSAVDDGSRPVFSRSVPDLVRLLNSGTFDFLVMHGGKFELKHFLALGVEVENFIIYDTLLSEKVIASNRNWPLSLDAVHRRYGGRGKDRLVDVLIKGQVCPSDIPLSLLRRRVCKDVQDTLDVFLGQLKVLEENGLLAVAYTKNLFSPVVADMEMNGMFLDAPLVLETFTEANREHNRILNELDALTGGVNMSSPKQKSEFIYGELGFDIPKVYGRPAVSKWGGKTDEPTLSRLKPKNKRQRAFLDIVFEESKIRTQIQNFLNKFMYAVEHNDGMIYGSINQEITNTQRLSSSNPNIQNIDRKLKKLFTARHKGWKIRQNDYSQLEFRGAGILSGCEVVKQAVENGKDVHADTASVIFPEFKDSTGAARASLRTAAKAHTFKPLYGGESGTKKEQEYYKYFKEQYSGISAWHRALMQEAARTGRVVTPTGLIFYFPNTRYLENGNVTNHTKIKNYPVQYFATGEIAVIGCLILWHKMKRAKVKSFIINEVHDSVVIEEHPDETEIMERLSHEAMVEDTLHYVQILYGIEVSIPIEIETELSSNWSYDK